MLDAILNCNPLFTPFDMFVTKLNWAPRKGAVDILEKPDIWKPLSTRDTLDTKENCNPRISAHRIYGPAYLRTTGIASGEREQTADVHARHLTPHHTCKHAQLQSAHGVGIAHRSDVQLAHQQRIGGTLIYSKSDIGMSLYR